MEGLIIAIIIGVVTSLLSGKGKKDDAKKVSPVKPFTPQKNMAAPKQAKAPQKRVDKPQRPKLDVQIKSLEDFTREVLGQLAEKSEPAKQEVAEVVVKAASEAPAVRESIEARVQQRQQAVERRPIRNTTTATSSFTIPSTQKELMQAIVMTEVLGKPKAKRR